MPLIKEQIGEGRGGRQISMYKVERPAQSTEQVLGQTCLQNKTKQNKTKNNNLVCVD